MFVVCGEALFDVFAGDRTPAGLALDARIGGSPFNVAMGLARLGQPVSLCAGIARGALGDRLMQALAEERIGTGLVRRLDAPATLSLVGLDNQGVASYSFYGHGAADRLLPAEVVDAVPEDTAAVHVGSYTMVVEPVASVHRALVQRWQGRALVSHDVNVRLNVEPSIDRWRAAVDWMAGRADLLKLSDEDAALLYPGEAADALAAGWRARGTGVVVMTRGAQGARAWLAGGPLDVPPVPTPLVDTVGAGDTFQAAMLAGLAERGLLGPAAMRAAPRAAWEAVLGWAARAAALTCARRGADLPRRPDLP
ncbi:carbohydrate kinase [Ideonella sp.]|uniref:carbohydrate kinase family protein n=1 Tax=Ideonella sp. TaxID=1929293 RepID=UPI0035B2B6EA